VLEITSCKPAINLELVFRSPPLRMNFAVNVCDTCVIVLLICRVARSTSSLASDLNSCAHVRQQCVILGLVLGQLETASLSQTIEVTRSLVINDTNLIASYHKHGYVVYRSWCSVVKCRKRSVVQQINHFSILGKTVTWFPTYRSATLEKDRHIKIASSLMRHILYTYTW